MSWVLGHSAVTYYSHDKSLCLSSNSTEEPEISLLEICKDGTSPCKLNPLLFNGHLQTLWTVFKNYDVPVYYKRHVFESIYPSFNGTFAVDFTVPAYDSEDTSLPPRTTCFTKSEFAEVKSEDKRPVLVVLHGLSGGSHELYLRHVLKPMLELGWEACVINSRGCAMTRITSGILYNARATWDIRQTVLWLRSRFPNRPLFGLGFSLGANILVNYLGEEAEGCLLKAAVVISNPWNLEVGSVALQRTWMGLEVYSRAMGTNMRSLFERHVEEIARHSLVDIEKVKKIKYLYEFDRELQCPTWGYPTEGAYYRDASSCDSLLAVRTPLFALHAEDDPVAASEALPVQEFKQNPWTVLCTTSRGGHLGWFESGGDRWYAKTTCRFLQRILDEVGRDKLDVHSSQELDQLQGKDNPHGSFIPMRRKLEVRG